MAVVVVVLALAVAGAATAPPLGVHPESPSAARSPVSDAAVVDDPAFVDADATGGLLRASLGCAVTLDAAGIDAAMLGFAHRVRFDNAHVYELGDDRYLWLVNDAFIDATRASITLRHREYVNNIAIVQDADGCFTMLHAGTRGRPEEFEQGLMGPTPGQFFWPLGGTLVDGILSVVWAQMLNDDPAPPAGDGIVRHPIATWLARYDPETLERMEFRPMPNSGVFPQYGFGVETVGDWTYLFGNSNLLNYQYEGGFHGADHSATRMYLARVPRGQLEVWPEYWTGTEWTDDATAATPISERFELENQMQVEYLDGRWVAVTKVDGFVGSDVVIDAADDPTGPWVEVARHPLDPPPVDVDPSVAVRLTYHPVVLPFGATDTSLLVVASANGVPWPNVSDHPPLYGTFALDLAMPTRTAAAERIAAARVAAGG